MRIHSLICELVTLVGRRSQGETRAEFEIALRRAELRSALQVRLSTRRGGS